MTAVFATLSSFFGSTRYLEAFDRFAVIAAVLCILFSTMAAVYFDSVLERKLQKFVVISSGLACCIIAAMMDNPERKVLKTESVFGCGLLLVRGLIWVKIRKKKALPETRQTVPTVEKSSAARTTVEKTSTTLTDVSAEVQETTGFSPKLHPLVMKGMILNPKTDRIIMIGKKTYENLMLQGYEPDLANGILVKKK